MLQNVNQVKLAILGVFAKLRKATIRFVKSVCPSVRMEQLGCHWTDFHKMLYLNFFFFENLSRKFEYHESLIIMTGTLHEDHYTCMTIPRWVLLRMRNVHTNVAEKIKTHILCSTNILFFKSCRLRSNVGKCVRTGLDTDGNIEERKLFACWIPKATDTDVHSEYVILIFHGKQWLHERA